MHLPFTDKFTDQKFYLHFCLSGSIYNFLAIIS